MTTLSVTPLGVSAGTPTRDRNVAALLVEYESGSLLLDCGEATQQQLMRSGWKPNGIDAILLTHLHGDHLFGLPGLLSTMSMLGRERPLVVAGPRGLASYVECIRSTSQLTLAYEAVVREVGDGASFEVGDAFRIDVRRLEHSIECLGFALVEHDRPGKFNVELARELGVTEGPMFGQLHRGEAVTLDGGRIIEPSAVVGPKRRGRKVVYCTDTRVCDAAAEIAAGADLLIHEATYGDDMAEQAGARYHATAREAASVAQRAAVQRLLLTHFSPRYEDPEVLVAEAREVFAATTAARQLERVDVPRRF